ncbi:Yos1-like protein [Perilla frutescens var. hirtella]|uniref:Yos1-like protein n=1 Tax=Perilla frutescens var. hirtella TaxID=608512 RepID=A0AAD4JJQ3_PERFH|nr:Yos1-like protein [Perilla frutescens var. hirtella]
MDMVMNCLWHENELACYFLRELACRLSLRMGLWTLLEGCLLLANALAILNEDRFLAPRGWSFQEYSGVKRNSFKGQILGLIYATQYLRVPLVLLNLLCIIVKMVSG